jgi:hypothetical protein
MTALLQMQAEFESSQLVTILAPCKRRVNEGGCIRVNASVNCTWYRRLCGKFPSSRGTRRGKFDTKLKRRNVARLLTALIETGHSRSKYAGEILRVARGITA